jgi:hypothetical protein
MATSLLFKQFDSVGAIRLYLIVVSPASSFKALWQAQHSPAGGDV